MRAEIKGKIEDLREKIRHYDYLYYVLSQPKISDKEYDRLMRELKELEDKYPGFKTEDSPTLRLSGGILKGFRTVRHRQKMLSLDNVYSFNELKDWDERVRKALGGGLEKIEYVAELKIDGVSANLTYEKAKLIIGATRGDGEKGEDVTENLKTIRAIPLVLIGKDNPAFIEIRGEVYIDKKEFEILNKERKKSDEVLFANPRNAASGSLKLLDRGAVAERKLKFFAHSLGKYTGLDISSQWEFLGALKERGACVNPHSRLLKSLDELIAYCKDWQEKREKLNYDIDGVVIKINSIVQQERLGFTMKSPRWAIAYKFPARQATTEILKININVGRTGVITPTAELTPVECSGVIIKNATLHNFDEIKRLRVKEGDRVLVERSGDVIPKIVKVVEDKGGKPFIIPDVCPSCSSRLIKEKEEEVAWRCINPSCPAQLERQLLHFGCWDAMDIEGLGKAVVSQLARLGMVKKLTDIYGLKKDDLLKLELFKDKKADNLLSAIIKSKERPLSRLVYALGIRHVGEKAAYVLAQEFKTLDNLSRAKLEDLDRIYEIGPVLARAIVDYFSLPQTKKIIEEIKIFGLNSRETSSQSKITPLSGKTVVFTGELKDYSRLQAEGVVRQAGGNPASAVSKNTDFVLAGENPGSKYDKAKKLGVKIINETEFKELLK